MFLAACYTSCSMVTPYFYGNLESVAIILFALAAPFLTKSEHKLPRKAFLALAGFVVALSLRILTWVLWGLAGVNNDFGDLFRVFNGTMRVF